MIANVLTQSSVPGLCQFSQMPARANGSPLFGAAYELAGDKGRAIADLEKALEIDPNLPTAREVLQRLKAK